MKNRWKHKVHDDTPYGKIAIAVAIMLFAIFFVIPKLAFGATYYCNPDSAWDTSDGSVDHPKGPLGTATVTQLEALLTAGDTVICKDGYHGYISWTGFDEGDYVLFVAENTNAATLSYIGLVQGNHNIGFKGFLIWPWASGSYVSAVSTIGFGSGSSSNPNTHITFDTITAYKSPTPFTTSAAWVDSAGYSGFTPYYGDSLTVINSVFRNHRYGILANFADSIYMSGNTIDGFYDDGVKLGSNAYFADNTVKNAYEGNPSVHSDMCQLYTGYIIQNVTIERNIFRVYDYDRTALIRQAQGIFGDEGLRNIVVRNNVVVLNWIAGIFFQGLRQGQIVNNTLIAADSDGDLPRISVGDYSSNLYYTTSDTCIVMNNISHGLANADRDSIVELNNYTMDVDSLDAYLFDYDTFDMRLAYGAIGAINTGNSTDPRVPDDDVRGYARDATPDIGAYEYDAAEEDSEEVVVGDERTEWFLDPDATGDETGVDRNNAFTLPDSIAANATAGDTISVWNSPDSLYVAIGADSLTIVIKSVSTIDGRVEVNNFDVVAGGEASVLTEVLSADATASFSTVNTDSSLAVAHGATGDGSSSATGYLGGRLTSGTQVISRGFGAVLIPDSLSTGVDSVTVSYLLQVDGTTIDTYMHLLLANHNDTYTDLDNHGAFTGFVAEGPHSGYTLLSDSVSTSTINLAGDSLLVFHLNAAGKTALQNAHNDTLRWVIISSQDLYYYGYAGSSRFQMYSSTENNTIKIAVYTSTEGGGIGSVSKDLGYVPRSVVIDGETQHILIGTGDDSLRVDAVNDTVVFIGTRMYVVGADTALEVTVSGNIGINNNGYTGTIIKGGGNLLIMHVNEPFDSLKYAERVNTIYTRDVAGADSMYRMSIANTDSITGKLKNSLILYKVATSGAVTGTITYSVFDDYEFLPSGAGNDSTDWEVTGYKLSDNQPWLDGTYAGSGDYTTGTITVKTPNGAETLTVGTPYNITWSPLGSALDSVIVYYGREGNDWTAADTVSADSVLAWTPPDSAAMDWLIRVVDASNSQNSDQSDAVFEIAAVAVSTIQPALPGILYYKEQKLKLRFLRP